MHITNPLVFELEIHPKIYVWLSNGTKKCRAHVGLNQVQDHFGNPATGTSRTLENRAKLNHTHI